MVTIVAADTKERIAEAKALFQAYAESLNFDLCFQNFDQEMRDFPGQYVLPAGSLFLALAEGQAAGCVGLRQLKEDVCEIKRLFVKTQFRGANTGRLLVEAAIKAGKALNYKVMRLDTVPSMKTATLLYKSLGFKKVEPYCYNPIDGAIYMELKLT